MNNNTKCSRLMVKDCTRSKQVTAHGGLPGCCSLIFRFCKVYDTSIKGGSVIHLVPFEPESYPYKMAPPL